MKRPSDVPPVHESSGSHAGLLADDRRRDVDQATALRQERIAMARPDQVVVDAVRIAERPRAASPAIRAARRRIAKVEHAARACRESRSSRRCRRGCSSTGTSSAGSRRCRRPSAARRELREHGCHEMNRVSRQVRIGDVPWIALDGQRPGQRSAAAVLDHVAECVHRRRLADDAVIDAARRRAASLSTTLTVPSIDGPSSSDVISSAMDPRRTDAAQRTIRSR